MCRHMSFLNGHHGNIPSCQWPKTSLNHAKLRERKSHEAVWLGLARFSNASHFAGEGLKGPPGLDRVNRTFFGVLLLRERFLVKVRSSPFSYEKLSGFRKPNASLWPSYQSDGRGSWKWRKRVLDGCYILHVRSWIWEVTEQGALHFTYKILHISRSA